MNNSMIFAKTTNQYYFYANNIDLLYVICSFDRHVYQKMQKKYFFSLKISYFF